jgi:hypothetical protein
LLDTDQFDGRLEKTLGPVLRRIKTGERGQMDWIKFGVMIFVLLTIAGAMSIPATQTWANDTLARVPVKVAWNF